MRKANIECMFPHKEKPQRGKASETTNKSQTERETESLGRLALITGGRLFGCGAWKEPHESSSHPALVDNLRVTWEIQR